MRVRAAVVAAMFAAACAAPAFAEPKTVKGEIVDQACFTKDKANRGESHKDCTETCMKKGSPVALVTSAGEVYTITGEYAANKNAKLVPHAGHTVEVTGEVSEKDGKMIIAVSTLKMAS
jgi:predicted lipoprotein with Yx(FWY)xxD motif